MSNTITSLDFNFSSNGGSHTASVKSVLSAVSTKGSSELGQLNGELGERYDFTNKDIANLMKQFVAIEETISEDSNNTQTVITQFQDIVSLKLDSHIVVVRGESASITSSLEFEGDVYKYSEHPSSPVPPVGNVPRVIKVGGVFVVGSTYSVKKDVYLSKPYSVGYSNKEKMSGLTYNADIANQDPEINTLSDYSLQYGYEARDIVSCLSMIGIKIIGLPSTSAIFNFSGKLSNIISSLASSLGYFWYINPISGNIEFINSAIALQKTINNPLLFSQSEKVNIKDASYTKSKLKKVFVNSFIGEFSPNEMDSSFGQKFRKTMFYPVQFRLFLEDTLYDPLRLLYGLYASKNWGEFKYDAIVYAELFRKDKEGNIGGVFSNISYVEKPITTKAYTYNQVLDDNEVATRIVTNKESESGFGDRTKATYYNVARKAEPTPDYNPDNNVQLITNVVKPSDQEFYKKVLGFYEMFFNNLYISRTFPEKTARKMNFEGGKATIYGPFKKTDKVKDIEELKFFAPYFQKLFKGKGDITLASLIPEDRVISRRHDYVWLALKPFEFTSIDLTKEENKCLTYDKITEHYVEMFFEPSSGGSYVGFKKEAVGQINAAKTRSATLYNEAVMAIKMSEYHDISDIVLKLPYTTVKRHEDPEDDTDNRYISDDGEDVSYDFERKYFNTIIGGADGDILHPADLIVKKGFIGEIQAFEQEAAKVNSLPRKPLETSSRTIYGLYVPQEGEFDITINGLTIRLDGGQGVSTTITESTRDIIQADDEFVVSDFYNKVVTPKSTSKKTKPSQRNFFGW